MRQVCAFARAIHIRRITDKHDYMSFHAQLAGAEIASLEEILGVNLSGESIMNDERDEKLTLLALQKMKERRNG